jgi:integrase
MGKKLSTGRLNLLSARTVQTAMEGDHADGGGLYLRVKAPGASWVFRFTAPTGKRREMGLGVCHRHNAQASGASLAAAREAAAASRAMLNEVPPRDPIDERDHAREAARRAEEDRKREKAASTSTLARVARRYHQRVIEPRRPGKYSRDWIGSLERHVPQAIWHCPVADIKRADLLDFLSELQHVMADTAHRVRRRLDEVFDEAIERELIEANPVAQLRGKLRRVAVPKRVVPRAALPYREVPAFVTALRNRPSTAALCLEFVILTASRTGEAIGATWVEVDISAKLWTVPADRMKGGEEHRVPLCDRAIDILEQLRKTGSPHVFPSPDKPEAPLSNMAMLTLLKRLRLATKITVHGFRSTFSTWANETGISRPDVIEACLAHRDGDRIRAAYNRAKFNDERRQLLAAWADFVEGRADAKVIPLRAA